MKDKWTELYETCQKIQMYLELEQTQQGLHPAQAKALDRAVERFGDLAQAGDIIELIRTARLAHVTA